MTDGSGKLHDGAASGGAIGSDRGPGLVNSLRRGLEVLDMFDREHRTISVAVIADHLGLHRSSASRLATTLASAGYLQPTGQRGQYQLGGRLAALGQLHAETFDLDTIIKAHLAKLTEATGETSHFATLDGSDAVTRAVSSGWFALRMHATVGRRSPAHCSSMGKVLLAGLSDEELQKVITEEKLVKLTERTIGDRETLLVHLGEIRRNGFSTDIEELNAGLCCVGAPIVGNDGALVGSISISGPSVRINRSVISAVADQVRWAAWHASADLGALQMPNGWSAPQPRPPKPLPWVEAARGSSGA